MVWALRKAFSAFSFTLPTMKHVLYISHFIASTEYIHLFSARLRKTRETEKKMKQNKESTTTQRKTKNAKINIKHKTYKQTNGKKRRNKCINILCSHWFSFFVVVCCFFVHYSFLLCKRAHRTFLFHLFLFCLNIQSYFRFFAVQFTSRNQLRAYQTSWKPSTAIRIRALPPKHTWPQWTISRI